MQRNEENAAKAEEILIEIINIEEFAVAGKKPSKARSYRIKIDKHYFTWHEHTITGRQLLDLAKKEPVTKYRVYEHVRGVPPKAIGLDEHVELYKHHLERFRTLPIDPTEGCCG